MQRKFLAGTVSSDNSLNGRQIRVVASTGSLDRAGDIVEPSGCMVAGGSVPVLVDHDPSVSSIVGRATIRPTAKAVVAVITFLPIGVSPKADLACTLFKSGQADNVSIGFNPLEMAPLKDNNGRTTGYRFTKWELLELSCVVAGANPDAVTVARSMGKSGRVLSAANAAALQTAHDHAEAARSAIAGVLDAAGGGSAGGDDDDDDQEKRQRQVRRRDIVDLADAADLAHDPDLLSNTDRGRRLREIEILKLQAL